MNFGLIGPIAERGLLVPKDLRGVEVTEHRRRANVPKDFVDKDEPRIVAVLMELLLAAF